jgi:hypothetical protein
LMAFSVKRCGREARRGGGRERRVRNFVDEKLVVAA